MSRKIGKPKMTNTKFLGSIPLYEGKVGEIFMVASINGPESKRPWKKRCWGWFMNLADAKKSVEMNSGDMYECEYLWVVIEKVRSGICSGGYTPEQMQWYFYIPHKVYSKGHWAPCKQPKWAKQVCGFTIG